MAGFNFKYSNIYYITYLAVIFFFVLLYLFWDILNLILNFFFKNMAIK